MGRFVLSHVVCRFREPRDTVPFSTRTICPLDTSELHGVVTVVAPEMSLRHFAER
jgi:hypothetical protein